MFTFKGRKVLFFKGTLSMPNVMYLPGKILVKRNTSEELYIRRRIFDTLL